MKLTCPAALVMAAALLAGGAGPAFAAPPAVLVSIAPLHALVAGVMQGIAVPGLLVKGGRTPHDFTLRPSDVRLVRGAALVIWVGPALEPYLARAIAAHAAGARVLAVMAMKEIRLLPARRGEAWETHDDDTEQGRRPGDVARTDPHVWLSPENAIALSARVARELAALDPMNRSRYAGNAAAVARRIRALDAELDTRLAPIRGRRYLVFHDAYRYFETRYRLSPLGAVSVVPGRAPGARRLARLRAQVTRGGAQCIFREPQFPPAAIATIRAGTGLRVGVLDPLGADLPPGPDHWFAVMRGLADGLVSCLSRPG